MRLIPRHRQHRSKAPRVVISEAEISADLHYPAPARPQRAPDSSRRAGLR